jgi:hypothetical protein
VRSLCDAEIKLKVSSDDDESGSNKFKQDYGGEYGSVWQSAFGGSLELGGRFCVRCSWQQSDFSRHVFTFNLLYKDTF